MTSENTDPNATESRSLFQTPDPSALNPNAGGESVKEKLEAVEKASLGESDPNLDSTDDSNSAIVGDSEDLVHRQNIAANLSAG